MKFNIVKHGLYAAMGLCLVMTSCQKMDRPELKEIILDPEPPPYNPLKGLWAFEGNANDAGESKFTPTTVNVTYGPGVNGQAMLFNADGYLQLNAKGDTTKYPNEFVGLPFDTLTNPGSLSIAFWMNGAIPIDGGAQGLVAVSSKSDFWGHFAIFLENYTAAGDPTAAFFKIHMLNANVTAGTEQWIEGDNMKFSGVLGKWTHMAFVYDAATSSISVYKDGVATATNNRVLNSGNYGPLKFPNFNGLVWGNHQFMTTPSMTTTHGAEPWAKGFAGGTDQARIYNKALTAAEVNQLFTSKE